MRTNPISIYPQSKGRIRYEVHAYLRNPKDHVAYQQSDMNQIRTSAKESRIIASPPVPTQAPPILFPFPLVSTQPQINNPRIQAFPSSNHPKDRRLQTSLNIEHPLKHQTQTACNTNHRKASPTHLYYTQPQIDKNDLERQRILRTIFEYTYMTVRHCEIKGP